MLKKHSTNLASNSYVIVRQMFKKPTHVLYFYFYFYIVEQLGAKEPDISLGSGRDQEQS